MALWRPAGGVQHCTAAFQGSLGEARWRADFRQEIRAAVRSCYVCTCATNAATRRCRGARARAGTESARKWGKHARGRQPCADSGMTRRGVREDARDGPGRRCRMRRRGLRRPRRLRRPDAVAPSPRRPVAPSPRRPVRRRRPPAGRARRRRRRRPPGSARPAPRARGSRGRGGCARAGRSARCRGCGAARRSRARPPARR